MKNITTVILAAGKSSRFKNNTSKIFQDLGGLSIIEHVYQLAKKISKNRIDIGEDKCPAEEHFISVLSFLFYFS